MQFRRKLEIVRALEPAARVDKVLWKCIDKLTNLRNAAAHRDYESLREERLFSPPKAPSGKKTPATPQLLLSWTGTFSFGDCLL